MWAALFVCALCDLYITPSATVWLLVIVALTPLILVVLLKDSVGLVTHGGAQWQTLTLCPAPPPPPHPSVKGAAVSVMSPGKPHQSQDLQTWSCGLVARLQPPASCLVLCTTAHGSLTPRHVVRPGAGCHCLRVSANTLLCMRPQCPGQDYGGAPRALCTRWAYAVRAKSWLFGQSV